MTLHPLQTRPLRQTLLFLRNNSLAVSKLQTDLLKPINYAHPLLLNVKKKYFTDDIIVNKEVCSVLIELIATT